MSGYSLVGNVRTTPNGRTEMRPDEFTPAAALAEFNALTPAFAETCEVFGGYPRPADTPTPDKRTQSKAWRLTNRVAAALTGDDPITINGVTVYPIGYGEEAK